MPSLNDRLNAADPTVRAAPQQPQASAPAPRPVNGQLVPQQTQSLMSQLQAEQLVVMQMLGAVQNLMPQAMPDLNAVAMDLVDQLRDEGTDWIHYADSFEIEIWE